MGQHGGSVLLLAGHASGAVRAWELKTQLGGRLTAIVLSFLLFFFSDKACHAGCSWEVRGQCWR